MGKSSWLRRVAPALVVVCGVLGNGCSSGHGTSGGTGSAEILAVTSSALSQADVSNVDITISGSGIVPALTARLGRAGNDWQGVIGGIPSGLGRNFHGEGTDGTGAVLYDGDLPDVEIRKDQKAFIALVMQQKRAPVPFVNSAPWIVSAYASTQSVEPGGTVAIGATATDPDGDVLTYAWTSDGGGTFSDPTQAFTQFTAPADGDPTLTLRVRDPKGASAAISFQVHVAANMGTGSASIAASFNDAPMVDSITIDKNPFQAHDTAQLGLVAHDVDGDAIASYEWTSTCPGTFSDEHAAEPSFTLDAAGTSSCAFAVHIIDDRGGWNDGQLSVRTGTPVVVDESPVVDTTFQTAEIAESGQTLTLRLKGHDPTGGAVIYAWSSTTGSLGSATTTAAGESEIVWTAPACFSDSAVVSAVVTASGGASTSQVFHVTASPTGSCIARAIQLVSVNSTGARGDGSSFQPSLSADGRYVAFASRATNLTTSITFPGYSNVFVRDVIAGTTTLVSTAADGSSGNDESTSASISADGRYVMFLSRASNLPGAPSDGTRQVYRKDLQTSATTIVSLAPAASGRQGVSEFARLSGDGLRVCFTSFDPLVLSDTNGVGDVYVASPSTAELKRLTPGDNCSISSDGRYVAFATDDALLPSDTNHAVHDGTVNATDVYVMDTSTEALQLVSDGIAGIAGPFAISSDGGHVAFEPAAGGVSVRDLGAHSTKILSTSSMDSFSVQGTSANGQIVVFHARDASSSFLSVYSYDVLSDALVLQSVSAAGSAATETSGYPAISSDGRYVSFTSVSSSLVSGDVSNGSPQVFVAPRR